MLSWNTPCLASTIVILIIVKCVLGSIIIAIIILLKLPVLEFSSVSMISVLICPAVIPAGSV